MSDIVWGNYIEANNGGKPLNWLHPDERCFAKWRTATGNDFGYHVRHISGWRTGFQIKLPANHPYYKARERGYIYWPGFESEPPKTWVGNLVLLNDLTVRYIDDDSPIDFSWKRNDEGFLFVIGFDPVRRVLPPRPVPNFQETKTNLFKILDEF